MYSNNIRKYLIIALVLAWGITLAYLALRTKTSNHPPRIIHGKKNTEISNKEKPLQPIDEALDLLRIRRNKDALVILDKILLNDPKNPEAIWGKAEVFKRARQYKLAELMFKEVLDIKPDYPPALISLAYLRYKDGDLDTALSLANQAITVSAGSRQNLALAYTMLGVINRAIPYKGEGFIARINKNLEIKSYFLKAVRLAPELQETHLGLGVFYLKTPFLEGGNLNAAIKELECAAKIAPEFADVNARLAQAYKRRGDTAKSKIYFRRARGLDPDNEILKEIEYSGTSGNKNLYRNERLMMGTFVEVISPNPEAGKIVFNEFRRIESLLSRFDSRSEISQLNRSGSLKVSPETFYIIKKSKEFWQASNGAFDITVAPLEDIWGFTNKQYRVPRKEELACALELTGSDKIILQDIDSVIKFKLPTMQVDLGGIAKGYAIDCAVKKLKGSGVTSCLINAGGQIYCLGDKFSKPWRVALKDPRKKGFTGYLDLKDKSVATSNSYEQYFLKERKRYSHIFNPKTGYPVDNQVISVTVIADDGLTADVLATAIFVLGKNEGEKLAGQFKGVKVRITEKSDVQNN